MKACLFAFLITMTTAASQCGGGESPFPPESPPQPDSPPDGPSEEFRSGFEEGVTLTTPQLLGDDWWQFLQGADQGNSWETGLPRRFSPTNGFSYVISTRQRVEDFVQTRIETVVGYNGALTRALYQAVKGDDPLKSGATRNQFGIYPGENLDHGYLAMRVQFQPDLAAAIALSPQKFRMVMEWWESGPVVDYMYDFRWNINVYRDHNGVLYWKTYGQLGGEGNHEERKVWECNSYVPVPVGQWFLFETSWRNHPTDGFVWAAVDGKLVADYRGFTQVDSGLYVWWPFKVYSGDISGYVGPPFYQWVDDVVILREPPAVPEGEKPVCETFRSLTTR